jgi:hypothetical protein
VLGIGLGGGGPAPPRLSRERKHRMRELATQKLAKAYKLDEIAASVATMQSASSLEDVANLVLARNALDPDAKYVHFFHEKIPSRMLAKCTSLASLDHVISERPSEGAPLRTRAVTRIFKDDLSGAAQDLTAALNLCKHPPQGAHGTLPPAAGGTGGRALREARMDDDEQPRSLETQLLFHRACTYLSIACESVEAALAPLPNADPNGEQTSESGGAYDKAAQRRERAYKSVRANAKWALRDFLKYLSSFEYTPGIKANQDEPDGDENEEGEYDGNDDGEEDTNGDVEADDDTASAVSMSISSSKDSSIKSGLPGALESSHNSLARHQNTHGSGHRYGNTNANVNTVPLPTHPSSNLFTFPFTSSSSIATASPIMPPPGSAQESLTYHPLLTDALHSLLLTHCLLSTPLKELLRHAHTAARLCRIADGYPVFLAARSPARADWIEVLRRCPNAITGLEASWESLCAPAPLDGHSNGSGNNFEHATTSSTSIVPSALSTLSSSSFPAHISSSTSSTTASALSYPFTATGGVGGHNNTTGRWAQEEGKEFPVCSERAAAVGRWVREMWGKGASSLATSSTPSAASGVKKKKRKSKGLLSVASDNINTAASTVTSPTSVDTGVTGI